MLNNIREKAAQLQNSEWFWVARHAAMGWLIGMGLNMIVFCIILLFIG